jgi:hypothetical protein
MAVSLGVGGRRSLMGSEDFSKGAAADEKTPQ